MGKLFENLSLEANVILIAAPTKRGKDVVRIESHNVVTAGGRIMAARLIANETGFDTGLTHLAIGNPSSTAANPARSDIALLSEHARKAFAVGDKVRSENVVQYRKFFTGAEANIHIREVGLFGTTAATSTAGSGTLFNRAGLNFDNSDTDPQDVTVVVEIRVQ
jgi:hypothetical protein